MSARVGQLAQCDECPFEPPFAGQALRLTNRVRQVTASDVLVHHPRRLGVQVDVEQRNDVGVPPGGHHPVDQGALVQQVAGRFAVAELHRPSK
jgi:hypothetical protein